MMAGKLVDSTTITGRCVSNVHSENLPSLFLQCEQQTIDRHCVLVTGMGLACWVLPQSEAVLCAAYGGCAARGATRHAALHQKHIVQPQFVHSHERLEVTSRTNQQGRSGM